MKGKAAWWWDDDGGSCLGASFISSTAQAPGGYYPHILSSACTTALRGE